MDHTVCIQQMREMEDRKGGGIMLLCKSKEIKLINIKG